MHQSVEGLKISGICVFCFFFGLIVRSKTVYLFPYAKGASFFPYILLVKTQAFARLDLDSEVTFRTLRIKVSILFYISISFGGTFAWETKKEELARRERGHTSNSKNLLIIKVIFTANGRGNHGKDYVLN